MTLIKNHVVRLVEVSTKIIVCISLLFFSSTVFAFDWSLKFEPGLSMSLTNPQSRLFEVGGSIGVKALFGLGPYVDIGPTVGFLGLPPTSYNILNNIGTGLQFGGGVRLKRPHDIGLFSPWIDGDILYVRTGSLNRVGLTIGAGVSFPINTNRDIWFGPYVRYLQIVQQPERVNYDNRDAKVLSFGVSLEFGSSHLPQVSKVKVDKPAAVKCPEIDQIKKCPACRPVEPVKVEPIRPELNMVIQFDWDDFSLNLEAVASLDQAVVVLNKNKSYDVVVEGHASSEGTIKHNQKLSENRALAVFDYFINHGIAKERLQFVGFGSTRSVESNETDAGRRANRRVTFKLIIVSTNGGVK